MSVWQIEENPAQRSVCRDCNRAIARGAYRFGSYELARWYHLDCAVVRNSRAFAPFAKEAAALLGPAAPTPVHVPDRNPELEARLVANPDDDAVAAVFADWLQSVDDPWGELIALELAGKDAAARDVLKHHLDDLIGELQPRIFEWRRGFIHRVTLPQFARYAEATGFLEQVLALRTAIILRELHAPLELPSGAIDVINAQAPSTLRSLMTWLTSNLTFLALPQLEELTLYARRFATGDHLAGYLPDAQQLPALVRFNLRPDRPLRVPTLAALLETDLVKQLTWFEIAPSGLDEAGERLIAARRAQLAHIPVMRFSVALDDVFPEQLAAWRARASEH